MSTFSRNILAALMGAAILSSCSRPVAYFQPSQREHFSSPKTEAVAVVTPAPVEIAQPVATETPAVAAPVAEVTPTKAEKVAQAKQIMSQVEAYVRNDNKLASNKKLTRRIAQANEMLATTNTESSVATNVNSAKKMSFMERTMLKKIDKKIKKHVAPEESKALNRNLRNGIILGAIGLILSLFGGVISIIGLILLIVGLVLIILGVLE